MIRTQQKALTKAFIAIIGLLMLISPFNASSQAESDLFPVYGPFDGDGWSVTSDGVLTIESNQGWVNCLKHGYEKYVTKLVIGKDVSTFRLYDLPFDLPSEDFFSKSDIIGYGEHGEPYYDYSKLHDLFPNEIVVESDNPVFRVVDGLLINSVTNELVLSKMSLTDVVIPEGVETITLSAFSEREIQSVSFPTSLRAINDYAFYKCKNLVRIDLPDSLAELKAGAFFGCSSLSVVNLSRGLTSIGRSAFSGCAIQHLQIPEGVQNISENAFMECAQLQEVLLPDSIRRIGSGTFSCCMQLSDINFPDKLEYIGEGAFHLCTSLRKVILPNSLRQIENRAFWYCDLSVLRVPDNLSFLVFYDYDRGYIISPYSKRNKCFGASSVETVIFAGSDYDFGYPAITDAKNVYFLSTPPEEVGQILDKDSVGNIYCSDEFEYQWTRSSVASWVRQRLTILPAAEIKAIAEEAVNATPEPIVTPRPTPTPLPTETPWPTPIVTPRATPRQEAPAEIKPVDPILFVFAGVIVGVIVGIVLVSQQAKKTKKRSRSKK